MDIYTLEKDDQYIRAQKNNRHCWEIYLDRATTLTGVKKGTFNAGLYSSNHGELER